MAPHEAARGEPQRHRAQARTECVEFRDEDTLERAGRERCPSADLELEHHKRLETCERLVHCDTLWVERRRNTAAVNVRWRQRGEKN